MSEQLTDEQIREISKHPGTVMDLTYPQIIRTCNELLALRQLVHDVAVQVVSADMRVSCQSTLTPKVGTFMPQVRKAVDLLNEYGVEFEKGELDV